MSESTTPGGEPPKKPAVSTARLAIWVIVGGIGLYLLISGLLGVISGGQ